MKPKYRSLIAAFSPFKRASIVICATLSAASLQAQQSWTGASDGLWTTAGNWNTTIPAADEVAAFDAGSLANLTIDLGGDQSVGGLSVTSPAGALIFNNDTLTVGVDGIDMSLATQNLTLNSSAALAANESQTWAVGSGATLTLSNLLVEANGATLDFDLSGGGTVNLSGATPSALVNSSSTIKTATDGDFAALDGSNNVVEANTVLTYTPNPFTDTTIPNFAGTYDFVDVINSNLDTWGNSAYRLSNSLTVNYGVRFNTPHFNVTTATKADWQVDVGSRVHYYNDGFHILVTENVDTDVLYNGGDTGFRAQTAGLCRMFVTNNSANDVFFNVGFSQVGGREALITKSGTGDVFFTGNVNATTGYALTEGTTYLGNNGASGTFNGGAIYISDGATFVLNRSDDAYTLGLVIDGPGALTQIGSGVMGLSGVNTFTGGTTISSGGIGAAAVDAFGTGPVLIDGGKVRFDGAFDLTSAVVSIGSSGAELDTNGNDVTLAGSFETGSTGSLTKTGAGSLSLDGDNDYSGGTTVTAGTLLANATTSSTGSGAVTVNSGAILGGDGVIAGAVTIESGATVAPGNSVGEVTTGSLDLDAGSLATFEFNTTPANDHIVVTSGGGLTIDGGAFELVQEGTSTPFTTPGTYNLIGYSGAIGGAGVGSLSVSNAQPGFSYTFAATGSEVTVTIATTGVVAQWVTDGGGLWTTGSNWSTDPTIPNGQDETALFTTELTTASSVDLDGAKTLGAMAFDSANAYTLTQGGAGALTLDNSGGTADIGILNGVHEIAADVALNSTDLATEALDAADGLDISGAVSGAGGVTKTGAGSLGLLASNTFTGDVDLQGGTTTFASGGLGAGTTVSLDDSALVWDAGNTDDISSKTVAFGTNPVTFDTNGNDVTLANAIGDSGSSDLTKAGAGTLELSADSTYSGNTAITGGTLQLGSGGTAGSVIGDIANDGQLVINRSDNVVLLNAISGTGGLEQAGSGDVALGVANTFSGQTDISAGTLTLQSNLALQNSTLNYVSGGGTLSFDTLTDATFGALQGDLDLALENITPAGVALTVGGNGATTTYSGILSGTGASLVKNGAGTFTLSGANTYDGSTFVNEGTLEVTGSISGTTVATGAGDILSVNGGSVTSSTFCDIEGQLNIDAGGVANYNGGVRGDNSDGSIIDVIDGTFNALSVERRRDNFLGNGALPNAVAATSGLVVRTNGVANVGDLTIGTSNSSAQSVVDGGELNVTGTVSIAPQLSSGRWCALEASSGALNVTDTVNGIVLAPYTGDGAKAVFNASGATCKVGKITFGDAAAGDNTGLVNVTAELYLGSGGAVEAAPVFTTIFQLDGGTLGAYENTSLSVPVQIASISSIYAGDDAANPFDIELAAGITGSADIDLTGDGTVTLANAGGSTGNISVLEGQLRMTDQSLDDSITVNVDHTFGFTFPTLNLDYSGGDRVMEFEIDGVAQGPGIYGAVGSGAPTETSAIVGTGWLYVDTAVPVSGYTSWAGLKGLTGGVNDAGTDNPESDTNDNTLEYIMNGDPLASDILVDVTEDATHVIYTFERFDDSETDAALNFLWSTSLTGSWTSVAIGATSSTSPDNVEVIITEDGGPSGAAYDLIVVKLPKVLATGGEVFGRFQGVLNP